MRKNNHSIIFRISKIAVVFFALISILIPLYSASAAQYTILKTMPDSGDWNGNVFTDMNIILIPEKVSLVRAHKENKITIEGNDKAKFVWRDNSGNYRHSDGGVVGGGSIGYKDAFNNKTISPDVRVKIRYTKAAVAVDGATYYDILLTVDIKQITTNGTNPNGVPIIYGSETQSWFATLFGAFGYQDYTGSNGVKLDMNVALYKAGTNTLIAEKDSNNKPHKMLWGFSDVDIRDVFNDAPWSTSSTWAENVYLRGGFYSPIYVSQNTQLAWIPSNGNGTTMRFYHKYSGESNVMDQSCTLMFTVNPRNFNYSWAGSACGTTFTAAAGTIYFASSNVYNKASSAITSSDSSKNNQKLTVNANSQTLTFQHKIWRNSSGPDNDDEEFFVKVGTSSGTAYGDSESSKHKHATFNKNTSKTVRTDQFNVNLAPGQTKNIWQELHYQLSNLYDTLGAYEQITCNKGSSTTGRACVQLYRPAARFSGTVDGNITSGIDSSNPTVTDDGTKITDPHGNYSIKFTSSIKRGAAGTGTGQDEAGGTASTNWHINIRNEGAEVPGKRIPTSGNNTTTALSNGASTTAVSSTDNYTFSGHLRYGEQREICAVMNYDSIVDYDNGNTHTTARKCIKVWREPKPCNIDTSNKFGVKNGENLGRIGVKNSTLFPNSDYLYTLSSPSSFNSGNSYTVNRNIWARPGDSIRFIQETCAGGAYAVTNSGWAYNVSSMDNPTYKSIYTTSGELSGSNSEGYLFGDTLPTRKSSDPLSYNKSRTWDSATSTSGTFMSGDDDDAEFSLESPSSSGSSGYGNDTYKCTNSNATFWGNHYQIKGDASDDGCNAKTMTGVSNDVGKTITQSLTWNHVKVTNGSVNTSGNAYKQNYTAKANVKIPYNYVIQPTISNTNNEGKKVVYLGANAKFGVNLHVLPRHNKAISDDSTENNYATITKPTNVEVKYYFKHTRIVSSYWGTYEDEDIWGEKVAKSNTQNTNGRIRLNTKGNLNGTPASSGGTIETVDKGGYSYYDFNVLLDDSDVDVGDQVCAEVSVWPADSHNSYPENYANNTVEGAGTNNIALSEDGSTKSTRTACYTIAKKPTISVEGANAYAGGNNGFITSRYNKQFNIYNSATRKYELFNDTFGSWSEYGVYGRVAIKGGRGIASGATFGYATGSNNVAINGSRSNVSDPANNRIIAEGLNSNSCSDNDTTVFSTQTFPNINCDTTNGSIGKAGIGKDQATHFRDRIRDRFYLPSSTEESKPNKEAKKRCMSETYRWNNNYCEGDDERNYYSGISAYGKVRIGNSDYMNMDNFINSKFDENGVNHTYFRSNAYLGRGSSFLTLYASHNFGNNQEYIDPDTGERYPNRNFTRLIQVTNDQHNATLIIDSDIRVGNYEATNETAKNNPVLHNTGEIVQFVIIADKVKITSRVNQIDAIIIADEVDTCAYDSVSDMANDKLAVLGSADFDANTCNSQLLFRAPVLTKKLTLNRTYGANNGTESIKRAEIFDLNPYTYLWSYGQMSRYSQAVTTYSREMPSRY